MAGGLFITLEGIDGSGKSTQAELLVQRLRAAGRETLLVREPGGTPVGECLRALLLDKTVQPSPVTEVLLYAAARAELVREVINPALSRGAAVVCDRYIDSSLAYQGYGAGGNLEWIASLNKLVTGGLQPAVTFLLDLPVREAVKRRRSQARDRLEAKERSYHERVYEGYRALARREPERIIVVEAARPAALVHERIWECLAARGYGGNSYGRAGRS